MIDVKSFPGFKISYRKGTEDEVVLKETFDDNIFYRDLPYVKFNHQPVIVDIGAHIGTFAIQTASKYPNALVYAFEASEETFSLLDRNIRENALAGRVTAINKAVSSKDGQVTLYHNLVEGNWGHTIAKDISNSSETVASTTLSSFMSDTGLESIDLIKFNCEGAEFEIIYHTGPALLARIKCAIVLYHCDLVPENYKVDGLVRLLNTAGHHCFLLHQRQDRGWIISVNKKFYSPTLFGMLGRAKRIIRSRL